MHLVSLKERLDIISSRVPGKLSVAYEDLTTGERVYFNSQEPYNPASIIKIPVMVEVVNKIAAGDILLSDQLPLRQAQKQWGSGNLFYARAGSKYSIYDLMETMIIHSDNTATKMLMDQVGLSAINLTMWRMGLSDTLVRTSYLLNAEGLNRTTTQDMAMLLENIYKMHQTQKNPFADMMLQIMLKQTHNSGLPKYLPKDVQVAHKTGTLNNISHDAGIVFANGKAYVVVVFLSSDVANYRARQAVIASVSRAIYDWRNGQWSTEPSENLGYHPRRGMTHGRLL